MFHAIAGLAMDLGKEEKKLKKKPITPSENNYPIQTGRGCPFDCEFCAETKFLGLDTGDGHSGIGRER